MGISAWIRRLAAAVFCLTAIPLLGLSSIDLRSRQMAALRLGAPEGYSLPPPSALKALSFGYNELGADLLWVRTIAYFADHLTTDHDLRFLKQHLSNILALDRRFKDVYRYGASMLMSQGPRQTNEHVMTAIDILRRAHQLWPRDWRYPLFVGAYYMNELRSPSTAQRDAWRRLGADWVTRASLVGAAASAPWLPALAANIYTEQGQQDLAIRKLQELYLVTQDRRTREQIAAKLKHLKADRQAARVKEAAAAFRVAYSSSGMSFVPEDLFVLVSLPELEPFSLAGVASTIQ